MRKIVFIVSLFVLFVSCDKDDLAKEIDKDKLLELVNKSRTEGCTCGNTA